MRTKVLAEGEIRTVALIVERDEGALRRAHGPETGLALIRIES